MVKGRTWHCLTALDAMSEPSIKKEPQGVRLSEKVCSMLQTREPQVKLEGQPPLAFTGAGRWWR